MTSRARRLVAAAASTALLGLAVTACAGDDFSDTSSSTSADEGAASSAAGGEEAVAESFEEPAPGAAAYGANESLADQSGADSATRSTTSGSSPADGAGGTGGSAAAPNPQAAPLPGDARSLIKKGTVALASTDVDDTLFQVRKVLAETGGEVAEDNTQADDEGDAERALLTMRVPVDNFDKALEDLKTLGTKYDGVDLIDSSSTTSDVSTQVIDTDVRVELQKRSIERISILLDRAGSIRDVVNIERELARREADLGSLQQRQAFLADQTSQSTITISVERPNEKTAAALKNKRVRGVEETGFVTGLENGWDAFQGVTTGLLTGLGALLPFAVIALLVGVPLRVWLRRRQAAAPVVTAQPQPAGA